LSDTLRPDGVEYRNDGTLWFWADGVGYQVEGLDVDDRREIRARLQKRMVNPLSAVLDELSSLPPDQRAIAEDKLWDRAYRDIRKNKADRVPSGEDVGDWLDTESGANFSMWIMLRKRSPDITEDKAADIRKKIGAATFLKARDEMSKRVIEVGRKLEEQQERAT
jgi:hypothetical protein